ncbi:MAG TPA: DUF4399 domain-containing protein [Thermoanaerobaculia bacterium]|nr:DUF4399 domain-containing protein [Thermoanaerobaculia bacterium]
MGSTTGTVTARILVGGAGALCLVLMAACGASEEAGTAPVADAAGTEAPAPRVYFVAPENGATVTSPVHVMFDVENFTIEPVGEGMVHEGMGHHHLAIDGDCLPPGQVIPTAEPWIHFGDGTNMIDVPLPPGQHKLTIQIGDGEHRTLDEPGLCASITVTVEEPAAEG